MNFSRIINPNVIDDCNAIHELFEIDLKKDSTNFVPVRKLDLGMAANRSLGKLEFLKVSAGHDFHVQRLDSVVTYQVCSCAQSDLSRSENNGNLTFLIALLQV